MSNTKIGHVTDINLTPALADGIQATSRANPMVPLCEINDSYV